MVGGDGGGGYGGHAGRCANPLVDVAAAATEMLAVTACATVAASAASYGLSFGRQLGPDPPPDWFGLQLGSGTGFGYSRIYEVTRHFASVGPWPIFLRCASFAEPAGLGSVKL